MTMTTNATDAQIEQLRLRAVNDVTREIMAHGIMLSHDQADDLGEDTMAWISGRLELHVQSTSDGVLCIPPKHYSMEATTTMTTMKITADTITDDQIRALQAEAAEAGDLEQVDLCRLALGMPTKIAWNTTPYGARIKCAKVIDAARAMTD